MPSDMCSMRKYSTKWGKVHHPTNIVMRKFEASANPVHLWKHLTHIGFQQFASIIKSDILASVLLSLQCNWSTSSLLPLRNQHKTLQLPSILNRRNKQLLLDRCQTRCRPTKSIFMDFWWSCECSTMVPWWTKPAQPHRPSVCRSRNYWPADENEWLAMLRCSQLRVWKVVRDCSLQWWKSGTFALSIHWLFAHILHNTYITGRYILR